jgi:hypothetical protein
MPNNAPSSYKLEAAMSRYMQLRDQGQQEGWWPQDEEDALAIVESETDVLEILDAYAERVMQRELLADRARARAKRLEEGAEAYRRVVREIMQQIVGDKIQRPLYTASITYPRKPLVTDEDALPKEFIKESPDMIAIGKALRAGEEIPGAELRNPMPQLTLRTA